MATRPPDPCLVHQLPPAPTFVGRDAELQELQSMWKAGFQGVLALVGLGGAGKTAIAARLLERLLAPGYSPRPEGLFVWSFYQDPDAGLFLQEAYQYFAGSDPTLSPAKGAGLLHLLRDALAAGGPHLLVLDGLERVQRAESTGTDTFGQIDDPLLRGLLTRIAEGIGQVTALVTSRFPLSDLDPFLGRGYRHLDVGGLDSSSARALLRHRGVQGDDANLEKLIETFGAHALTLDHLGGLIGQFLGGDPARAPELEARTMPGSDRQALRLARLLRAYEEHLPHAELTLLCRLCLLRRSVSEEQIMQLFLCAPAVHARTVRELADLVLRLPGADRYPEQERHDLAESIRLALEEALCAAPISGPEEIFRHEVCKAAELLFEEQEKNIAGDLEDLVRPYANALHDSPTDQLPLSIADRQLLCRLNERHHELREHPHFRSQQPPTVLEQAFKELGYPKPAAVRPPDLSAADILTAYRGVQKQLKHLISKHFALQRVRQLCRTYQQKWSLAGPLAHLDDSGLRRVLDSLVARHLVLREGEGTFSVHPAVRDHFARLAAASERESWHDILREQMVSLIQRPGRRLPDDPATLDLAEEAVYHALQAGRADCALWIYNEVIGGLRHLGWKLGEMARGLRILREFNPCPDRWALAWYLRALGELEEAYQQNGLPSFRADIRLLQGRLPQVAAEGDDRRTAVAAFLMGQTQELPRASADALGCVMPRDQLLLYTGRLPRGERSALLESFYQDIGWEGDRARYQLLLAEMARRQADTLLCRRHLDAASRWVLHSGSVEHLCLLHLMRARAARATAEFEVARRAAEDGLHLARQCGSRTSPGSEPRSAAADRSSPRRAERDTGPAGPHQRPQSLAHRKTVARSAR